MFGLTDFEHLAGRRLPGGTYRLPGYESWLWADAVGAEPTSEVAHPGMAYMIGLHGGGASIQAIFDMFGADADSGVLFGAIEMEFFAPLVSDREYLVEGEILSVKRKQGKRTGPFDLVTFRHRIRGDGGDCDGSVATVTHTWIFPRGVAS